MRPLHLLRRPQEALPPVSLLLHHQLQHPQQALRVLLFHPEDMQLLWVPPLRRQTVPFLPFFLLELLLLLVLLLNVLHLHRRFAKLSILSGCFYHWLAKLC
ncbi:hypothetical protein BHE74_00016635 [Ensete ventricosum]|nr:hypothetical protein BHE74_00016635 [Ensete ventricosum]